MPKQKTHSGAKKRFRRTSTGRIKCRKGYRNHILTKKPTKLKRQMRGMKKICAADSKSANRLLDGC